ncbi:MAG: RNA-binding protein [Bryobacteraceae bacterium]
MFCSIAELRTESDVEQKLLWPVLTTSVPNGAGLLAADILTKLSIRRLEIGKGTSKKLYYPDYMVVLAGLPVLVIEAKAPDESIDQGLTEARLYGNELNALFPSGVNPCMRVLACNGHEIQSALVDTADPDIKLKHSDISAGSSLYAQLIDTCRRAILQKHADDIRRRFRKPQYRRAVSFVGGPGFQNEELPPNTFGATIAGDYGHIFNPRTPEERALIVREAYVPSLRRQRYVEPIDRLIRSAVMPSVARLPTLEDSSRPSELSSAFRERRNLENQVLLLVGSVGSGKSTFIDYVSLVALPEELRRRSVWVRVNLNNAPLSTEVAYAWIAKEITNELKRAIASEDVDDLDTLQKIFRPELNALRRGALKLLDSNSIEYKTRLTDELLKLQRDDLILAKSLASYICAGPGKLLVIVLDNCDKRTRDEQLTMFQVAQWVRTEFRCLVILPLRDVTFDRHRNEPPLDTAIKALTFRIEPPPFIQVLQERVRLALNEMGAMASTAPKLSYVLPNGMHVSYPAADQGLYLASILKSLFAHDRFVRRIMTGLAGRDVRRALEIFLDFCMSGHIGEDEIYKIRFFEGNYVLPLSVVARVLLRMQRRYYDGDKAHVKNLVQCSPDDALPDHFVRLAILHWLERRQTVQGPAGVAGFHLVDTLLRDLAQLGHDANRVRGDLMYLIREGCVVAEHQRVDVIDDSDLVRITASGLVHLQLMANPEYLAACAEDTFLSDLELARRVADRITSKGLTGQFSRMTSAKNAWELVGYLKLRAEEKIGTPETYLEMSDAIELKTLREAEAAVGATEIEVSRRLYVGNIPPAASAEELRSAFADAGLGVAEVVVPPRASGNSSRWFAIVEMIDGKDAMEAVDSRELKLKGRRLVISEAHSLAAQFDRKRGNRTPRMDVTERLHVAGLPPSATETTLRTLFHNHGLNPVDVHIVKDRQTGRPRGFGFVAMGSQSEAIQAIGALNGSLVEGRTTIY